MKTQLPVAITTVQEAEAFLTELHNNGETFHPEDDAHEIVWNGVEVSTEEADQLNKLMTDIYNLDGNDGNHAAPSFDPCGFLLDLSGHVMEDDEDEIETPENNPTEKDTLIGLLGLKVRVMGTSEEQPLTTQANFIMKEIVKYPESLVTLCAELALDEEREVEHLNNLADQITGHPREDFVLFSQVLDAWILEVDSKLKADGI